jgi:hypothetical protein
MSLDESKKINEKKWGKSFPAGSVPLFRFYSGKLNDHFYTASLTEINTLPAIGMALESCLGFIGAVENNYPVYRAWSPGMNDHFYTNDLSEYVNACKNGYNGEGIAGYGKPQSEHTIPLYRYWLIDKNSPDNIGRDHFYTTDENEVKRLPSSVTVSAEGVLCYIDRLETEQV